MDSLVLEGIEPEEKSKTDEQLFIILKEILPSFTEYILKKIMLKKKWLIYLTVSSVMFCCSILIVFQLLPRELVRVIYNNDLKYILASVFAAGFLVFGIMSLLKLKNYKTLKYNTDIERIGQTDINFAEYPLEHGVAIVDEEGVFYKQDLIYPSLKNALLVKNIWDKYTQKKQELPYILSIDNRRQINNEESGSNQVIFDSETEIHDFFQMLDYEYKNLNKLEISLGLVPSGDPLAVHLLKDNYSNGRQVNNSEIENKINSIMGVIKSDNKGEAWDIDDYSEDILKTLESDSDKLNIIRNKSLIDNTAKINSRITDIMHYCSYDFYCPACHEKELSKLLNMDFNAMKDSNTEPVTWNKNARVYMVDWKNEVWRCRLCEKETTRPIPVHKIYANVLLPAYQSLLLENEKERIKIYSELNSKKIEYQQRAEKEQEEIERTNRSEMDEQVFKMRALKAQVESTGETIKSMQELIEKINQVSQSRLQAINEYSERIQNEIVETNNAIIEEVKADVEKIRKETSSEINKLAYQARIEQKARDKVQKQMAENLQKVERNTKISAAVDLANARRAGMLDHPWWKIGANLSEAMKKSRNRRLGRSEFEAALK